jgi:ADP-heptose:LPS heptosyltransferase
MIISKVINGNKNLQHLSFQNILCIKEDEIGDLCYSVQVFESLKNQFSEAKITILCKPFAIPLVKNNPFITQATSNWNDLTGDYDLIVDLRGSWRSNLYALRNLPKARLDRGTVRFRNKLKGSHPHEVTTNLQVIEPLIEEINKAAVPQFFLGSDELKKADQFLNQNKISSFAVLHTGARRQLRKWPLSNYAALAHFLKEEKHLDIIFCGDQSDLIDVKDTQKLISFNTYSVAGNFSISEFSALVSKAKLFVGNESGPLHIASVVKVPSLGLFGPGEPYIFYPYGRRTDFIHHILECNPCDQVHCVHPENTCMQRITLEEVKKKIEQLLEK